MKKISLLFLIVTSTFAYSQSLEKESYTTSYIQGPSLPIEKELSTYTIEIDNTSEMDTEGNQVIKSGELHGFKFDPVNPDFIIKITIKPIEHDSYVQKKMGTESFNFTVESRLNIRKEIYSTGDEGTYYKGSLSESPAFTIKNTSQTLSPGKVEAEKALKQSLESYKKSNIETLKNNLFKILGEELNALHGYAPKTFESAVYSIKPKNFEYTELEKASTDYIKAMLEYGNMGLTQTVKDELSNCLKVWEAEIDQLDQNDKKARINRKNVSGLYLNVAQANMWLQNFDLAEKNLADAKQYKGGSMYEALVENLNSSLKDAHQKNLLREAGTLNIEKETPVMYSEQFIPTTNGWRLTSRTDYYGEGETKVRETKKYSYYRGFLVSEKAGIFSRKYTYDNDSLIASVYKNSNDILAKCYIKEGKPTKIVLYSNAYNSGETISESYAMHFNDLGDFLGYTQIDGKQEMKIKYEKALPKEVVIKRKSQKLNDTSHYIITYKYQYLNNNIVEVDGIVSDGNTSKYIITKDNKGKITNVKLQGWESTDYRYNNDGNLVEELKGTDTGTDRYTYDWEKSVGNNFLFGWIEVLNTPKPPFVYPTN